MHHALSWPLPKRPYKTPDPKSWSAPAPRSPALHHVLPAIRYTLLHKPTALLSKLFLRIKARTPWPPPRVECLCHCKSGEKKSRGKIPLRPKSVGGRNKVENLLLLQDSPGPSFFPAPAEVSQHYPSPLRFR